MREYWQKRVLKGGFDITTLSVYLALGQQWYSIRPLMSELSQMAIFSVQSGIEPLSIFMAPQVLGTIPTYVDKWGLLVQARLGFRTKAIAHSTGF
jgi:hypothetical protein